MDRSAYMREYRAKNRERERERDKKWREENPQKRCVYNLRYWAAKARENGMNPADFIGE